MSVIIKLLTLMKLTAGRPIVDPATGAPTPDFLRYENDKTKNEQTLLSALVTQVNDISAALERANIAVTAGTDAQMAADSAQTAASAAQSATDTLAQNVALISSYVAPSNILSAAVDAIDPTKAVISIAGHTRHYADGTSVAVNAGPVTGLALSTTYYVSYIDARRIGGTMAYQASAEPSNATQGRDRHTIGSIATPVSGGSPTSGRVAFGPGIPT